MPSSRGSSQPRGGTQVSHIAGGFFTTSATWEISINTMSFSASLVAQRLKRLAAMRETRVRSLDWEDSPGEGNGNPLQYSCLENPMDGEPSGLQSMGLQRVGHD